MSEPLIITISGMRGIVSENLTDAVAAEYGSSFGTFLKKGRGKKAKRPSVCIGRDSRPSGPMLMSAVAAGLCAVGVDVVELGIVTTPGVGVMVRHLGCSGGVVITASHNPIQYNGIKLLLDNGVAPPAGTAEQIRKYFFDKKFDFVDSPHCGKISYNDQADAVHIEKVLAIVDVGAIKDRNFKVVLDSVNGAGGRVTMKMLDELGCKVVAINDRPTGLFAHRPEPTAKNLNGLCEVVKKESAQAGFAQDPDADRLAIIDEDGNYIGEEYTLALAARQIFGHHPCPPGCGKAATNLSTSRMLDDVAKKYGGKVIRTAVGEANVAEAMLKHKCDIGGEGNGGVIDLRVGPVRDSLVAIALVLQLMTETDKTVSQLAKEIGCYYMSKDKFVADSRQAEHILAEARKIFPEAKVDTTDGCRFDFEDGWVHLRASNTEPVMRLIVEAKDRSTAKKYIDAVSGVRRQILGPPRRGLK